MFISSYQRSDASYQMADTWTPDERQDEGYQMTRYQMCQRPGVPDTRWIQRLEVRRSQVWPSVPNTFYGPLSRSFLSKNLPTAHQTSLTSIIGTALCAEYLLRPFEPKFTNINLHCLHYELFEKEGECVPKFNDTTS